MNKDINYFAKVFALGIIGLIVFFGFVCTGCSGDSGRAEHYNEDYEQGYAAGYNSGSAARYDSGSANGCEAEYLFGAMDCRIYFELWTRALLDGDTLRADSLKHNWEVKWDSIYQVALGNRLDTL